MSAHDRAVRELPNHAVGQLLPARAPVGAGHRPGLAGIGDRESYAVAPVGPQGHLEPRTIVGVVLGLLAVDLDRRDAERVEVKFDVPAGLASWTSTCAHPDRWLVATL